MTGLRLHPVLFESKALTGPACSDHSHPGEAKNGDFATTKFRYFLWVKELTWITDCSSLKAFFEQRDMPNHQLERVRMRMLCYQFTIAHRNSNMVKEVDLLTRYNIGSRPSSDQRIKHRTPKEILCSWQWETHRRHQSEVPTSHSSLWALLQHQEQNQLIDGRLIF